MSAEAAPFEVRDRIARLFPDERHERWMMRVVLGCTDAAEGWPEVLAYCTSKRSGEGLNSRVDLWAPMIEAGKVTCYPVRPSWARKGWQLGGNGYLRKGDRAHGLLHSLFLHGAQLLELDPWGDNESDRLEWRVREHLPLYREVSR